MTAQLPDDPSWVHGHAHDPHPAPPTSDPAFVLVLPDGVEMVVSPVDLERYPLTSVPECYIVSTGHGTSGPFSFGGVRLFDLLQAHLGGERAWSHVDVISADNFGTRIRAGELIGTQTTRPIILSYLIDGVPLTRAQGLVRLIVPSETDDALRQVKWVARIEVHA
jgi:DMSO/TMAO reductase YedYZ molybdopterin-dependent catalytic subunit